MTRKPYPTDVVEQVQSVYNAWVQISEDLTLGDLNTIVLEAEIAKAAPLHQALGEKVKRECAPVSTASMAMILRSMKWSAAHA